jgi:hypothetical protein
MLPQKNTYSAHTSLYRTLPDFFQHEPHALSEDGCCSMTERKGTERAERGGHEAFVFLMWHAL